MTAVDVFAPFHRNLPFHTFDFGAIRAEHFPPALTEGRRRHKAEMEALIANPDPPDFANTIEQMSRVGQDLERVETALGIYGDHVATDEILAIQEQDAPLATAHDDDIGLDPRLWARIKQVHETRLGVGDDPERIRLLEETYREFVRSGALLSEEDKARLRALNEEEAVLEAQYDRKLLAARKEGAVSGRHTDELAGLEPGEVDAAVLEASARREGAGWTVPLVNTTIQPAQEKIADPKLRERLFAASTARNMDGPHDTRSILVRLSAIRAEQADLLGFPSYAAYVLDAQMTKTPERMSALLRRMAAPATSKAAAEARSLAEFDPLATHPAHRPHAEAALRRRDHELDTARFAPYFTLDNVLRGLFFTAKKLYGLSFSPRSDLPVFDPDVRVYDVHDESGKAVALFYLDPFARSTKSGGAWMNAWVDQSRMFDERPVVVNALNLVKPAGMEPATVPIEDIITAFHEFGHGLHGMLANVYYPGLSGTAVATDFVELPSQIHEHWAFHPDVLPHYAIHHQTGEVLPPEDAARLVAAQKVGQGYASAELSAAALLDLAWHGRSVSDPAVRAEDVAEFERRTLVDAGFDPSSVPPRYSSAYFAHIWTSGYSANYGSYVASAVLECDGFAWFEENGGLTRENGEHFRRTVLSRGNTAPPDELYRAFRGRDPEIEPFLIDRGLTSPPAPSRRPRP